MSETIEQTATVATAQPAPTEMSITTGTLSEMFLSLDGHDKAQPGYDWRKGWNDAIRQAMDYAQPAPSAPDGVAEALQRLIENGAVLGPGSAEDALLVARYRQHLLACAPSVPDGYKLVPIVSTDEMDNAGADHCDGYLSTAQAVWDAMLAAAPEAKP